MIGYGLRKLANEHGMNLAKGIAYGDMNGFAVTLSEGMGYKKLVVTTSVLDQTQRDRLRHTLDTTDLRKKFRVIELLFVGDGLLVTFYDNIGTMKKIRKFIDWLFPLLKESGATDLSICTRCGGEIVSGCWKLLDGAAYHMHGDCGDSFQKAHAATEEVADAEKNGSYFTGFLGALGGAVLGAIVWTIVLMMGYVTAIVGFLIGWLAERGYNLFHGKQGRGKTLILIAVVVLGVLIGTVSSEVVSLVQMINNGELPGFTYGDIPWMLTILLQDSEYLSGIGYNLFMGLLFAALGVYALIYKAGKAVAAHRVIDLP